MNRAFDFQLENRRQAYLDALYHLDGRGNPEHPAHGTYTGLYLRRIEQLLAEDLRHLTTAPKPASPVPVAA